MLTTHGLKGGLRASSVLVSGQNPNSQKSTRGPSRYVITRALARRGTPTDRREYGSLGTPVKTKLECSTPRSGACRRPVEVGSYTGSDTTTNSRVPSGPRRKLRVQRRPIFDLVVIFDPTDMLLTYILE